MDLYKLLVAFNDGQRFMFWVRQLLKVTKTDALKQVILGK